MLCPCRAGAIPRNGPQGVLKKQRDYWSIQCFIGGKQIYKYCRLFGIHSFLLSLLFTSLKSLPSISLWGCCMLWELGVALALALILLGFVDGLPFLCRATFRTIHHCCLKLSCCKRVLLWVIVNRKACATERLFVCLCVVCSQNGSFQAFRWGCSRSVVASA